MPKSGSADLDDVDLAILTSLQEDGRMSKAEIARRVGVVSSAVSVRIDRLEVDGVIQRYEPRIDPRAVGLGFAAFVFVRVDEPVGVHDTSQVLARLPEVQEIHNVAGEDCYLLKVRVEDPTALAGFLRDKIGCLDAVVSTRTTVVLETLKETAHLAF